MKTSLSGLLACAVLAWSFSASVASAAEPAAAALPGHYYLAFIALYREVFETVRFYSTLAQARARSKVVVQLPVP